MIQSGLFTNKSEAKTSLLKNIENGKALEKFEEIIIAQGGDLNDIYSKKTENKIKFISKTSFIIVNIGDSIHMKYLNNPKNFEKTYVDYISKTNQKEHTLETFKELTSTKPVV